MALDAMTSPSIDIIRFAHSRKTKCTYIRDPCKLRKSFEKINFTDIKSEINITAEPFLPQRISFSLSFLQNKTNCQLHSFNDAIGGDEWLRLHILR